MIVKLPLLTLEGFALTVLPDTMVIGSSPGVELVMAAPFTLAALKPTVPKSASGRTPPLLDGAWAITSADASRACFSRAEFVCVQPLVWSTSVRVNVPRPSVVTDPVN